MLAVVANKIDDYFHQAVSDEEGQELAKQINGVFQTTSAKIGKGIDELFIKLGKFFLNPESMIQKDKNTNTKNNEEAAVDTNDVNRKESFVIKNLNNTKKKKKCC